MPDSGFSIIFTFGGPEKNKDFFLVWFLLCSPLISTVKDFAMRSFVATWQIYSPASSLFTSVIVRVEDDSVMATLKRGSSERRLEPRFRNESSFFHEITEEPINR